MGAYSFNRLIIRHLLSTGDNKDRRAAGCVGSVLAGISKRLAESAAAINSLLPQIVKHCLDTQFAEPLVMSAGTCSGSLSDNDKFGFIQSLHTFSESVKISLRGSAELETVIGELNGKILKNLIGAARLKLSVFFLKGFYPGLSAAFSVLADARASSLALPEASQSALAAALATVIAAKASSDSRNFRPVPL